MAPPSIPSRWLDYKPIGHRIEGTRFVAFKVPLSKEVNQSIDKEKRLDKSILLERIPNLGVIIDLTNTHRYYDPKQFEVAGVDHRKLSIPGRETPSPDLVKQFKQYVNDFLIKNSHNDKLIGVHCTHGVNRTGYLICNYMITEMTMEPDEAIKKFSKGRGHSIERNHYINALKVLKPIPIRPSSSSSLPKLTSSSTALSRKQASDETSHRMINDAEKKSLHNDHYMINSNQNSSICSATRAYDYRHQTYSDAHYHPDRKPYVSDYTSTSRSKRHNATMASASASTSAPTAMTTSITRAEKWNDTLHTTKRNYDDRKKRHYDVNDRYYHNNHNNNNYNIYYNNNKDRGNNNDYHRSSNIYNNDNRNYNNNYRRTFKNTNYNYRHNNMAPKYINPFHPFNTSTEININRDDRYNGRSYRHNKPYDNYYKNVSYNSELDRKYRKYY